MTATRLWTAESAAAATGGRNTGAWAASGVSIDSRTLEPGDLFVALEGPNFDGHRFIPDALAKGAAAVVAESLPEGVASDTPALLVRDTLAALHDLGRAARQRSDARVIAVTGSVGKTGTKEALRAALAPQGKTHAALGSFNNHWGLPLSLARMPADTAYAVFEIGMNHPGEIAELAAIARPEVAVITAVEAAHTAFFDSVEDIADAKAEIFSGVVAGGAAVLPRDNPHYERLRRHAQAAGIARIYDFGRHPQAQARLHDARIGAEGSAVEADIGGRSHAYDLALPGEHWVINSLAVLAAVAAAGADIATAAGTFARLRPADKRGERHVVHLPAGRLEIIDDSYNANPSSVRAALSVLARCEPGRGGRRIAVLGDMRELGARSAELHAGLAEPLREARVDLVHTCGEEMAALRAALSEAIRGAHAADSRTLADMLAAGAKAGDVVLVKGSKVTRMHRVVDALRALDQRKPLKAADGS